MSRKGDCFDNACAESFISTLKNELVHHVQFKTRGRLARRSSSSSRCSTIDSGCIRRSGTCLPPSSNDATVWPKELSMKSGTAQVLPFASCAWIIRLMRETENPRRHSALRVAALAIGLNHTLVSGRPVQQEHYHARGQSCLG